MNVLTLSIKQKYFDEIVAGTKKFEYREITPRSFDRYLRYTQNGKSYKSAEAPEDGELGVEPVKYDALKLLTGAYNVPKRPYLIIEVKNEEFYFLLDDNDENIILQQDGEEYLAAEIEYELGNIIERSDY